MTTKTTTVNITEPKIELAQFHLIGTAPLVQARFSEKAQNMMMAKHAEGSTAKKRTAKAARDFDDDARQAMHVCHDGKPGVPAGAFRAAMISACRLVGYKMTIAKLSVFVDADGFDRVDNVPLVYVSGEYEFFQMHTRNATGVADIRSRPMWKSWTIDLRVKYDADQFTLTDVSNLVARVGLQVGIGEGRPDSRESAGLGWGTFRIEESK